MTEDLVPCKRCKTIPKVVEISGLYYVQCEGTQEKILRKKGADGKVISQTKTRAKCDKWQPYEFLGASRRAAIEAWNFANTHKILETEE